MQLYFHGGKCCGVKTIGGFGSYSEGPDAMTYPSLKREPLNYDKHGQTVDSTMEAFPEEAPIETLKARLVRILAYVDKWRPSGIVEVALAQNPSVKPDQKYDTYNPISFFQINHWNDTLIELGFEKVGRCHKNSNSGNLIQVYHRYSTPKPRAKKEKSLRDTVEQTCATVEIEMIDDLAIPL